MFDFVRSHNRVLQVMLGIVIIPVFGFVGLSSYLQPNEAAVKQSPGIRRSQQYNKGASMIETFTAILCLFSASVFVAHAVDAYRAP